VTQQFMGRALLWATALSDCRDCLDLALRLHDVPENTTIPTTEAQSAARHLVRLAIVYFGQLYTPGFEDLPSVASNTAAAAQLDELERHAFSSGTELAKFYALRDIVLELRHRTIAHADGKAFSVRHDNSSVRALTPMLPTELYNEFRQSSDKLLLALLQRLGNGIATS